MTLGIDSESSNPYWYHRVSKHDLIMNYCPNLLSGPHYSKENSSSSSQSSIDQLYHFMADQEILKLVYTS